MIINASTILSQASLWFPLSDKELMAAFFSNIIEKMTDGPSGTKSGLREREKELVVIRLLM